MAGEAIGIIGGRFSHQRLVRIMTGCALNARVSWAPASAPSETIRLKPYSLRPHRPKLLHLKRSTVTAAAEVIQGSRPHLGRIDDFWCDRCSSLHRLNVPRPWAVAGLARDSRNHLHKVEFAVRDGGCVVATKALLDPAQVQLSPERLVHRTWNRRWLACRDIQAFHRAVVT